jgi:ATP-dependent Clp protease ATP-binding subunit ClpA
MSHFERFNREARSVLAHAQNEAIPRDHTQITPTHLLMGMVRERRSFAADALRRIGLHEPALILALDFGPDEWRKGQIGDIDLSPRSKNVLRA